MNVMITEHRLDGDHTCIVSMAEFEAEFLHPMQQPPKTLGSAPGFIQQGPAAHHRCRYCGTPYTKDSMMHRANPGHCRSCGAPL